MNLFKRAECKFFNFLRKAIGIVFLSLVFSCELLASDDLCIGQADSVTGGNPTLDGIVENDNGYTKGTRIPLGDVAGGGVPNFMGYVRMVEDRNSPHVWLGFDTEGFTTDAGTNDMVVLAFSSGGGEPDTYMLVQPFSAAGGGSASPPFDVQLFRVSGGVLGPSVDPAWANTNIVASYPTPGNKWQMEMKIPKVALGTPYDETDVNAYGVKFEGSHADGTILFYATVLHTSGEDFEPEDMTTTEASWPSDSTILAASTPCPPFDEEMPASANFCELYNPNACTAIREEVAAGVFETIIECDIEAAPIPQTSDWTNVSLGDRPACEGITLAWSDIGTTSGEVNEISLSSTNTFFATPQLSPGATNGAIEVTYQVAKWGIPPPDADPPCVSGDPRPECAGCGIGDSDPSCWQKADNPADPSDDGVSDPATVGPGSDFNVTWLLSSDQAADYSVSTHQCITATMSSSDPAVVFKNDSVRRNMDFVPASRFEQSATISGKGYGDGSGPDDKHRFIVSTRHVIDRLQRKGKNFSPPKIGVKPSFAAPATNVQTAGIVNPIALPALTGYPDRIEAMTWIANGYLQRPVVLKLGDNKFKLAEYVGGFGYVASHENVSTKWSQQFSGNTLVPTQDPRVYVTEIAPGEEAVVNTVIEAEDFRLALNARVGSTYPHDSLSNDFDSDRSYQFGIEYLLDSRYSIEAIFANHELSGSGAQSDEEITQFSLNGRYYLTQGVLPLYATTGVGTYDYGSSGSDIGVNIGVGLDYEIARRLYLEAAYNYHDLDKSSPDVTYSTLQVGLRYLVW